MTVVETPFFHLTKAERNEFRKLLPLLVRGYAKR
jgi:hypothetical protein